MKKWIVWLLVIVTLTILSIYIFIPSKIAISGVTASGVPASAEFRLIRQQISWDKWWKDSANKPHVKGEPYTFNGTTFRLSQTAYNIAGIEIEQDGNILQSELRLLSINRDSTWILWNAWLPSGNNPFTRLIRHKKAEEISKNMSAVLKNLKDFSSKPNNVYDISIFRTSFQDTNMLSTRFYTRNYPSNEEVYRYFDILKKSIQKQHGKITGYPLMDVRRLATDSFETQVAIPTNHALSSEGSIFFRKMVPGNFLCAIITGGEYTMRKSLQELDFYLNEHGKTQVARPFEQLITDRINEPDTTKWITKIYLPVVQ